MAISDRSSRARNWGQWPQGNASSAPRQLVAVSVVVDGVPPYGVLLSYPVMRALDTRY